MKMIFFGIELPIWLTIILIIILIGALVFLFNFIMRKVFNLNKKDVIENKHINALHKSINRWLFVIFIALLFVGITFNTIREPLEPIFLHLQAERPLFQLRDECLDFILITLNVRQSNVCLV